MSAKKCGLYTRLYGSCHYLLPVFEKTATRTRSGYIYLSRQRPRGGTPDFKWRGWSKDFFGFEIFDSGIFLGMKIWQVFFWMAWFKYGFFWVFKMVLRFMVVPMYPGRVVPQIKYNQTCSCPGSLVLFRVVIHNVVVDTEDVLGCP